jgi:excisionase family DNA binding protein
MRSDQIEDLITPAEAARLRGVTRSAITDLVKRGRLSSIEVGGRPFLYRKEVMNFKPEITGRPPNANTKLTLKMSKKGSKR